MKQKTLVINDRVYGKVSISEPVILELINSKPLQRLKDIGQFGVPDQFYHFKNFSRFDHSIGVFIILQKLNATREEQIAGLLHDISHTAFSHVIDWVIGEGDTEDYQDTKHQEHVLNPAVSKVLKKYNFDPLRISNHQNFPLLEQRIPNLCADRIDYALKEFPISIAKKCFKDLNVINNRIVFNNKKTTFLFAKNFLNIHTNHWGGSETVIRYRLFANVLRIALKEKIISFSDFKKDDNFIVKKLLKSKNKKIYRFLKVLKKSSVRNLPKGDKVAYKKFRYVDPMIYQDGKFVKLSNVNKRFETILSKAKEIDKKGIRLPKITALQ